MFSPHCNALLQGKNELCFGVYRREEYGQKLLVFKLTVSYLINSV